MAQPVWLEVALNGPFGPKRQPHAPYTAAALIDEGLACARAGAAIIHLHVYDEATGIQNDAPDTYVRVIEAIREKEDVIVYPTVPMGGGGEPGSPERAKARYTVIDELGRRGLLEWSVVDPGSCNLARFDDIASGGQGVLYPNTVADIDEGLRLAREHRFHPSYAVYEPGFLRLGAALAARHGCPAPIYRFMFSDEFTFGYPPADYAVESYVKLLEAEAPGAAWMVAGLGVDIFPLAEITLALGGHLRVGQEDTPFGWEVSNVAQTERMAAIVARAGRELATAADVRKGLAELANTPAA
jgi:3-keto-5-aminohexanoate cleavage enzyme